MNILYSYIMLGCANQRNWEKFCVDVINKPEWITNQLFIDNTMRLENIEYLENEIETILILCESTYWLDRCEKAGVPAGPINRFDTCYWENENYWNSNHFLETPGEIRTPAPLLGEHTEQIIATLNFSKDEVDLFEKKGIIKSFSNTIAAT
ncbi:CoA transferase [Bacillus sp. EB600]|uniref:CoA transferase n=1 Tax=Bacillus sp. EB600 TaxID=2806345 RepID=UPI00210B7F22|nr:CoA transferase [Bacillus sp. EB600]MCQ6279581.1 CoA transferase [Bacillus sp. EB600]